MNRQILRLALPNILSNLTVPLVGMVDTALMGRMETEAYLGAIALGGIIFNFIYWGFGFLRMGTTGMVAQAYGRKDERTSMYLLGQGLTVALGGSILVIVLQEPIAWLSFWLIQGEAPVEKLAAEYFYIRIYAAPATLSLYVLQGWFLGMQNARYPMFLTIAVNAFNLGFNLLFVYGLGMKSDGVAWGTVCAQYLGLLLGMLLFWERYRQLGSLLERKALWQWQSLKRFFALNADIFVRTLCLIFVFAFFTTQSAKMGSTVLAANQVLQQYLMLMAFGVDGFAYAAESLVGRFTGSREGGKLRLAIRWLFVWGLGIGAVFSLVYALLGREMLQLFTDLEPVMDTAREYLPWLVMLPLLSAAAFMWDGVYIGATATRAMRNTMLLATFGVFLPLFYLVFPIWENHGLWLAMSLFMVARSIFLSVLATKNIFF